MKTALGSQLGRLLVLMLLLCYPAAALSQISQTKVIADDGAADDWFGAGVAISGDYAIISANNHEHNVDDNGAAYVYQRNGNTWNQVAELITEDTINTAVAIDGDYALVSGGGGVYVFQRVGATWNQMTKLTSDDPEHSIGSSVSIDGDYALIGDYADDDEGVGAGAAYVFQRVGATWNQVAKLTADDAAPDDYFGFSVSLDGDYALIGATLDDAPESNSGSAYVFQRVGVAWNQVAKLTADDVIEGDIFGFSVSLDGDYALVGAHRHGFGNQNNYKGAAYVFQRVGTTWNQVAKLFADEPFDGDQFAYSVSLDGNYALMGANLDDAPGIESGSAYIFQRIGTTWNQVTKLTADDGAAGDSFGRAVSLDGGNALVGAQLDDGKGSAYIFSNFINPEPAIAVDPESLDFGTVNIGTTTTMSVTIHSIGLQDLEITDLALKDGNLGFSLAEPTAPISPGGDSTVTVQFMPAQEGDFADTLEISHNANGSPTLVPLSGASVGPVTLEAQTGFGMPGDTLLIPLFMSSPLVDVAGLQVDLILSDPARAEFVRFDKVIGIPDFTFNHNTSTDGATTRLLGTSTTGASIPVGMDQLLGHLVYVIKNAAPIGADILISLTNAEVSDPTATIVPVQTADGSIQVGKPGDINLDNRVSIVDVVGLVRMIIGLDPLPQPGTALFAIADVNDDGEIDVADVVAQINLILALPKQITGATGPVASSAVISLEEVKGYNQGDNTGSVVPVSIQADGLVSAIQLTLSYNPSELTVNSPMLIGSTEGMTLFSNIEDGRIRLVIIRSLDNPGITFDGIRSLHIPVNVRAGSAGSGALTLEEVKMVDAIGQYVPITPGNRSVTIRGVTTPAEFRLNPNAPNPFNPSTTIAYEVPRQSHVRIIVYNLLGEEVIRLVDEPRAPGRYSVIWNGRNGQGQSVASGLYMYRMTTDTGFTKAQRMVLLK